MGVIAFGVLNPDPAYAPTFQTAPEDRPSVLERAGETGLAVAIGAVGIKLGQIGSAANGAPNAYSVAFETTIPKVGAGTRPAHFKAANESLLAGMRASPELNQAMRQLGIEVPTSATGAVKGLSPSGWTWHHVPEIPGVMQLVPRGEHTAGSGFYELLHPTGRGGFFIWGKDF